MLSRLSCKPCDLDADVVVYLDFLEWSIILVMHLGVELDAGRGICNWLWILHTGP
jgi:hypothetical protein